MNKRKSNGKVAAGVLKKKVGQVCAQKKMKSPFEGMQDAEVVRFLTRFRSLKQETRRMTAADLQHVKIYSADVGGYQRRIQQGKVDNIGALAGFNVPFPGILLVCVNGVLYYIDGHHRGLGIMQAGGEIDARIVHCDLDNQARWLFILHNFNMTKIKLVHLLHVSKNPVATEIRGLAKQYGASVSQVRRLLNGITAGAATHGLDLVGVNSSLSPHHIKLAEEVLKLWTSSNLWRSMDKPPQSRSSESVFSGLGTLHLAGIICREQATDAKTRRRELLALYNANWNINSRLAKMHGTNVSAVIEMKTYFTTTLLRGVAGRGTPSQHKRLKKPARQMQSPIKPKIKPRVRSVKKVG